jgi:phage terminase small subunit
MAISKGALDHLVPATRAWVVGLKQDYALEPHHDRLLQLAAEAWDRCQQARQVLATDGLFVESRQGLKPHPAVAIERDSRLAFARLIAQLSLDDVDGPATDPTRDAKRSTRAGGWRGSNGKAYV